MSLRSLPRFIGKFVGHCWRGALLLAVGAIGFAVTGCASTGTTPMASNEPSSAPTPEWYQSNDNPFHAD
jgi:hypothetical protein